MIIDQTKYLCVTFILFLIGLSGIFLNRKNIIIMLMSIELMLLAINFNLIVFSVFLDDIVGQLFALLIPAPLLVLSHQQSRQHLGRKK